VASTGARAKAWCLLIHVEVSPSISQTWRAIFVRPSKKATDAPVAESTYDPNCKILCGGPGQGCLKLTGDAFKLYNKNPGKWEKEHKMQTPKKSGMDAKKKAAKNKTIKEGELADAASGL